MFSSTWETKECSWSALTLLSLSTLNFTSALPLQFTRANLNWWTMEMFLQDNISQEENQLPSLWLNPMFMLTLERLLIAFTELDFRLEKWKCPEVTNQTFPNWWLIAQKEVLNVLNSLPAMLLLEFNSLKITVSKTGTQWLAQVMLCKQKCKHLQPLELLLDLIKSEMQSMDHLQLSLRLPRTLCFSLENSKLLPCSLTVPVPSLSLTLLLQA